jgi:hypothetical protein
LFETFVPEGVAVVVPPEQLDAVAAFAAEDEQVARQRVAAEPTSRKP